MKNQQKNQSILKIKVISFFMLVFISVNSFATETQSSSSDQEINSLELRQNRAQGSEIDDRIDFTVINPSEIARSEIVRISLPVEENITNYKPANWLVVNGKQVAAQTRVITGYPNGSPRRIMLSFEAQLEPNQELSCQYDPKGIRSDNVSLQDSDLPAFYAEENGSYVFSFPTHRALIKDDKVILKSNSDGQTLATLEAYGPELDNVQQSNISVIETGTYFTWLRWTRHGSNYTREVDFQVDRLGHIKITQRILRHLFRNDWTPDFGFKLTAMESKPVRLSEKPLHFLQFDPESTFVEHPELIASLKLSNNIILSMVNPLALRQNRGTLEADIKSDETTVIRTSRIEPVKDENNKLMIQEGIWRVTEVLLYPEDPEILATSIDHPLVKKIDWEAYDKIYNTGPPLQLKNPVLNEMVQRVTYVLNKMSINGDDWGNMTSYDPTTDTATINSMLRFNHCQYVWEDYFRTGDPLLRRIAVEWSENYRNFSVYWGPRERFFGGGRNGGKNPRNSDLEHGPGTYMERQNNAIHFCTKGFHNFWLTYEETGDPCFKEAAEAQARWSAEYVHTDGQTRNIGLVTDFIKLFDYTGDSFYLDQALRLWEEFKASQCPDLLFTQGGKFPTGNDLFIRDDEHGYQHPFYKAYIIQYATIG